MAPSILHTIMRVHIKRLGLLRVVIGALGIYLTIPAFMVIHGAVVVFILRRVVFPLLSLDNLRTENHIILDRYRVEGLSFMDKFNCLFCGWANGICTLLNRTVDAVSERRTDLPVHSQFIFALLMALYVPPAILLQIPMHLLTNHVIASALRFEKISYRVILREVLRGYPIDASHNSVVRIFLIYQKVTWIALERALEQIESSWCPIKHFERMDSVTYPLHHKRFFEPEQIRDLHDYLLEHGTVLKGERGTMFPPG